tara:strand:- start:13549 stop:13692 length:144 start_codon:yes stop_codon:yes gene_type:complete
MQIYLVLLLHPSIVENTHITLPRQDLPATFKLSGQVIALFKAISFGS